MVTVTGAVPVTNNAEAATPVSNVANGNMQPECTDNYTYRTCTANNLHGWCSGSNWVGTGLAQCERPNCWCSSNGE
jgi:hypothetical protein